MEKCKRIRKIENYRTKIIERNTSKLFFCTNLVFSKKKHKNSTKSRERIDMLEKTAN